MNISSHSSPDATPEPLQPENIEPTTDNSPPVSEWESARADLSQLLNAPAEPTVFDEEIEDAEDNDFHEPESFDNYGNDQHFEGDEAATAPDDEDEHADIDDDDHAVAGYVEPRGPRWPAILIGLALVLGIGGGGIYYKMKADAKEARRWAPIAMPDKMAFVPIDWSASTLAQKLQKSDKVRDAEAFTQAAKEVELINITPGGYALPEKAGPRDLAQIFKAGPTHEKAVFPPGFTGLQIAARLKSEGFGGANEMEKLIYPSQGFSPYEGTLGPGTYWMPIKADGKTLIAQMQEEFAGLVKKLPEPLPTVKGKQLTTGEIVTIASLVERESNLKSEMPVVAGVMMNRLEKGMRLQIDASVQYARILADKDHKSRLYFKDYKFESPFNTYLHDGLPPTPICNPGEDALMAAARPAKTSSLFYVYSPKLKKHIFANDFEGHKHNVAIARQERDAIEKAKN